ncbi:unnamed protein product, partial [Nesidiocoris tenuis]
MRKINSPVTVKEILALIQLDYAEGGFAAPRPRRADFDVEKLTVLRLVGEEDQIQRHGVSYATAFLTLEHFLDRIDGIGGEQSPRHERSSCKQIYQLNNSTKIT